MKENLDNIKKRALKELKEEIEEMLGIATLNIKNCPWVRERGIEDYIKELRGEIEELEEEVKKGRNEGVEEEVGDVFWDAVMLLFIADKEKKAKRKEALRKVVEKIKGRKPWLIRGERVSKEEAERAWNNAKKNERKR